jgi:hypothetical protein
MRYLGLVLVFIIVSGCTRFAQPATPVEQEEQEERMREFLDKSSPRNMSDLPKVTPEFIKRFNTKTNAQKGSSTVEPSQAPADEEQS